jgi:hypothetical protein
MPTPRKGETRKGWMARCVPELIHEGRPSDQAVATCTSMFERRGKHDILVWGPAAEGEKTASGRTIEVPGWVWSCSCGQSGIGYPTEDDADHWAGIHLHTAITP